MGLDYEQKPYEEKTVLSPVNESEDTMEIAVGDVSLKVKNGIDTELLFKTLAFLRGNYHAG